MIGPINPEEAIQIEYYLHPKDKPLPLSFYIPAYGFLYRVKPEFNIFFNEEKGLFSPVDPFILVYRHRCIGPVGIINLRDGFSLNLYLINEMYPQPNTISRVDDIDYDNLTIHDECSIYFKDGKILEGFVPVVMKDDSDFL